MKIKSVKLINFKKFVEETEFTFGPNNLITGKNGQGKTAIKDAIIFCLYNRTADGSLADSTRLISDGKMKCLVEVVFETKTGTHTVRRERTHKQTRITYVDHSQSEEDSTITQESLLSLVPTFEDFSSVFDIGQFMRWEDRKKRDYILKLTPSMGRRQLFQKMGGQEDDIEIFQLDFEKMEQTHKHLLVSRRENIHLIDDAKAFNVQSVAIEIPSTSKKDCLEELKLAEEKLKRFSEVEYAKREHDRIIFANEAIEKKNASLQERIAGIVIEDLTVPSQEEINKLIIEKNSYAKTISLPQDVCPTCLRVIDQTYRDQVENVNIENKNKYTEIEKEINEKTANYSESLARWKVNEENKQLKLMLEAQFSDPLPVPEIPAENTVADDAEYQKLKVQHDEFITEQSQINALNDQENKRKIQIENNRNLINDLSATNDKLSFLINLFSPKGIPAEEMNQKLQPIKDAFKKFIPSADIITLEPLKNEMGYKEVFTVLVDGREYPKLSLGEKTRVDIAISQIINSLLFDKIDVFFLDNSEVLDSAISIPAQSFICKVTLNNLTISN